jgi:hypothetical protein
MYQVTTDGEPRLLTAGANPPDGVVVTYYLPESTPVSLTISDDSGKVVRSYSESEMPSSAGVNRFVWNMRYPGVSSPTSPDLGIWERKDGPLAVPGSYTLVLGAGGDRQEVTFNILLDPRVETSASDLAAQRDFLLDVADALRLTNETIDRVDALRGQLAPWAARIEDPSTQDRIKKIGTELDGLRNLLIDVHIQGSQLYPSGLHEKFNALLDSADGADYAPPQQALDVFAELTGQLDVIADRLNALRTGSIADLNTAIAQSGAPVIG